MVQSPCVSVCRISLAKETCDGCYRTLEEIARWRDMTDAEQLEVVAAAAERRAADPSNVPVTVQKLTGNPLRD